MFQPLKIYFEGLQKCPITIQNFFKDVAALFWMKFVDSQFALSNEYILKTESRKIASFEVANEVINLRNIADNRKKNCYIPAEAVTLFNDLSTSKQKDAKLSMSNFYSELTSYLEKYWRSLDGTEVFSWMILCSLPDWETDVKPSITFLQKHFAPDVVSIDSAFDEMVLLRQYVAQNLTRWNETKTTSEFRWIETFKSLNNQNRPIKQISLLVQYAFAIPGTSTEVERLFSIINDVWGPDKGQMKLETLEAHLNVKVNSNKGCDAYYNSIKLNKKLLAQVQGGDKYKTVDKNQPYTSTT